MREAFIFLFVMHTKKNLFVQCMLKNLILCHNKKSSTTSVNFFLSFYCKNLFHLQKVIKFFFQNIIFFRLDSHQIFIHQLVMCIFLDVRDRSREMIFG